MVSGSFWMEHLDSMPKLLCPRCKGENILRRTADTKKVPAPMRWFRRSYCRQCKYRWSEFSEGIRKFFAQRSRLWVFVLSLIFMSGIAAVIYFVLNAPDPVPVIKKAVVDIYDNTYGTSSRKQLWQDWNWLYRARKSPAKDDYYTHRTSKTVPDTKGTG